MSDSPAGSFWSVLGTSLLLGCAIMLLLLLASLLGWIGRLDDFIGAWMGDLMNERFPHQLPAVISWLLTSVIAFGLPALLLTCRHGWQRMTVWLASIAVIAFWVPVLCLAAHQPNVSLVWLAVASAGLLTTLHLFWQSRKAGRKIFF